MNRTIIQNDELKIVQEKPTFVSIGYYSPKSPESMCPYCGHVQIGQSDNCVNCNAERLARMVGLDADENKVYYLDA